MNDGGIQSEDFQTYFESFFRTCMFLIGQLPPGKINSNLSETDVTEESFPHNPDDFPDFDNKAGDFWKLKDNFAKILDIITKIKDAGNTFYRGKDYKKAISKYKFVQFF